MDLRITDAVETPQAKHSPGPWHVKAIATCGGNDCEWAILDNRKEGIIAETNSADHPANAYLLAAAPDLLASLRSLLAIHDDPNHVTDSRKIDAARAAIAKAQGGAL